MWWTVDLADPTEIAYDNADFYSDAFSGLLPNRIL
jgi:hypothetical protein